MPTLARPLIIGLLATPALSIWQPDASSPPPSTPPSTPSYGWFLAEPEYSCKSACDTVFTSSSVSCDGKALISIISAQLVRTIALESGTRCDDWEPSYGTTTPKLVFGANTPTLGNRKCVYTSKAQAQAHIATGGDARDPDEACAETVSEGERRFCKCYDSKLLPPGLPPLAPSPSPVWKTEDQPAPPPMPKPPPTPPPSPMPPLPPDLPSPPVMPPPTEKVPFFLYEVLDDNRTALTVLMFLLLCVLAPSVALYALWFRIRLRSMADGIDRAFFLRPTRPAKVMRLAGVLFILLGIPLMDLIFIADGLNILKSNELLDGCTEYFAIFLDDNIYAPSVRHLILIIFGLAIFVIVYIAQNFGFKLKDHQVHDDYVQFSEEDYKKEREKYFPFRVTEERWSFDQSSFTFLTISTLYGTSQESLIALSYCAVVAVLQLTLLRLYGMDADKTEMVPRADFGDIPRPGEIFVQAAKLAMNQTGLSTADLGDAENKQKFDFVRDETYDKLLASASESFRDGLPLKLATYFVTGMIMMLFAGRDVINGCRLLLLHARMAMLQCVQRISEKDCFGLKLRLKWEDKIYERAGSKDSRCTVRSLPSLPMTLVVMAVSTIQINVPLIVLEYCRMATQTETDMRNLVINFLALTFIMDLDELMLGNGLTKPWAVRLTCDDRHNKKGSGGSVRAIMEGETTLYLCWSAHEPQGQEARKHEQAERERAKVLPSPIVGQLDLRGDGNPDSEVTKNQLAAARACGFRRLLILSLLPLMHKLLLLAFSQHNRLDVLVPQLKEPTDVLQLFLLIAHMILGWLLAVCYTQSSRSLSTRSGWVTLCYHVLGLVIFHHASQWALGRFLVIVVKPAMGEDVGFLLDLSPELLQTTLGTFAYTTVLGLGLGRSVGEIVIYPPNIKGQKPQRPEMADLTPFASWLCFSWITVHFGFSPLPTGVLDALLEGAERFAAVGTTDTFHLPSYFIYDEEGIPQRSVISVWFGISFLILICYIGYKLGMMARRYVEENWIKPRVEEIISSIRDAYGDHATIAERDFGHVYVTSGFLFLILT